MFCWPCCSWGRTPSHTSAPAPPLPGVLPQGEEEQGYSPGVLPPSPPGGLPHIRVPLLPPTAPSTSGECSDNWKLKMLNHHSHFLGHQCRVLNEAMEKIGVWLHEWKFQKKLRPVVLDIFRNVEKGRSLVEDCKDNKKGWVIRALAKEERKEDFLEVLQGFILSLETIARMFGDCVVPSRSVEDWVADCVKDAECSAFALKGLCLERLTDAAKKDRQNLIFKLQWLAATPGPARMEQRGRGAGNSAAIQMAEQVDIAQFLLGRLQQKTDEGRQYEPFRASPTLSFLGEIGEGASARVYAAEWQGAHVAVKRYNDKDMFDAEMHVMQSLAHVNVIRVIGYHVTGGREPKHCLIMECMKSDLDTFIDRLEEELPLGMAIEILLQVAKGMAYLHANNIIHRDLKPKNILLDRCPCRLNGIDGYFTAKVTDFGVSRKDFHTMTATHVTGQRGTTNYMAPEVWVDGHTNYSKKVDVYSFGMVCYKVLTQKTPPIRATDAAKGQRPDVASLSSCPEAIVFFIQRCWDGDAKKRPSFSEVCDFLTNVKFSALMACPIMPLVQFVAELKPSSPTEIRSSLSNPELG